MQRNRNIRTWNIKMKIVIESRDLCESLIEIFTLSEIEYSNYSLATKK